MKNNSPTAAGQTKAGDNTSEARIDAINQVFALFKLNYHNQFYKAFSQTTELNSAKRLWLEALAHYTPETLLRAARSVIESSEFLPTLRTMIQHCQQQGDGALPDPHSAYIEACSAPSPKAGFNWSHPAVYYAGKASDWFFLQTNSEKVAFPVFKQEYEKIVNALRDKAALPAPQGPTANESQSPALDKPQSLARIQALKNLLDL